MGSFNGKRRAKGSAWRENMRARQRRLAMEPLENRRLLAAPTLPPIWKPSNNNMFDAQNGPMADEGADLVGIYKEYTTYLTHLSPNQPVNFVSTKAGEIYFQGNSVEIDARGYGNGTTFAANLQALGMQVLHTSAQGSTTIV